MVKLSITIMYHCHLHHVTACIASEHFVYNVHCDVTGIHIHNTCFLVEFTCLSAMYTSYHNFTMLRGQVL